MDAVSSATATTQTKAQGARSALSQNFDMFLTLLTTQLQNQDPLSPMDSNEFTKQLVQFSGVEQAIATNQNLESLIALVRSNGAGDAVAYLGKNATVNSAASRLENGKANWTYELPAEAEAVSINVTNAQGRVVFTAAGEKTKGTHDFAWDGKDQRGNALPDGQYTIQIQARGADGKAITAQTRMSGMVSAVDLSGNEAVLTVGGVQVPLSKVLRVSATTDSAT